MSGENKKKLGRPSLFKEEFCDALIEHMSNGFSFESFAAVINVNRDTLYEWTKKHQIFSDAQKMGQDKSRFFWENLGIQHIINQSESVPNVGSNSKSLNATIWIFNMKNRFGWRDKKDIEVTDPHAEQKTAALSEIGTSIVKALDKWNG